MCEIYHVPENCSLNVSCENCDFKKPIIGTIPMCLGRKGMDVRFVSLEEIAKMFASYGCAVDHDCVTRTQVIVYLAINGFLPGRLEHLERFWDIFPDEERDPAILCLGASFEDDGTRWAGITTKFLAVREFKVQ